MSRELTIGEADAARAMQAACVAKLRGMAAFMRRHRAEPEAALYDTAADALERLQPGADTPPPAGWSTLENRR